MQSNKILLVSDLDGTLLNSQSEVSAKNRDALRAFMQQGGLFTVATGRDPADIMRFFPDAAPNVPLSCFNGSMIFDYAAQEEKMRLYLDESILPLLDALTAADASLNVEVYRDDGTYIWNPGKGTDVHLAVVDFVPTLVADYHSVPFPWTKVAFWLEPERIPALTARVAQLNSGQRWHFLRVHTWSCELLHPKSDKGWTLDWFRQHWPQRTLVAIGDNENDVLMLRRADLSFAPANAFPPAKAAAGCVLPESCDGDAVAAVLRKLAALPD